MRIYFFSSTPCTLAVNGEFCGKTDGFRRYLNLSLQDSPFIEWTPPSPFLPLSFFLTEKSLSSPPFGVKICLLPNAVALYADKFSSFSPPAVLLRTDTKKGEFLLYENGKTFAFWQNTLFAVPPFKAPSLTEKGDVLCLFEGDTLCALHESGVVFQGKARDITFSESTLSLLSPLKDLRGRHALFEWNLSPVPTLSRFTPFPKKTLPPEYNIGVLMEALRLKEDISPFVCDDLLKDADGLREYFQSFLAVRPLGKNVAGAFYKKGENVYEMRCFRAALQEGKIANVTRFY